MQPSLAARSTKRPRTSQQRPVDPFHVRDARLFHADVSSLYHRWPSPIAIVSDGPYGVGGFPGDPPTPAGLAEWYAPHIEQWSKRASPLTTLWFWNSELGWATVHPVLERYGWEYRVCHVWNKGIAHISGNCNGQVLRQFPVVTEVCVQYVRKAEFPVGERMLGMQEWLRYEWERTGLPLYRSNEASGVMNAATRKYFTKDHLFYYPPVEAFEKFVAYANKHGASAGRPYFSIDGERPLTAEQWKNMRAKFNFEHGVTNVWDEPAVRNGERVKHDGKCVHNNQKPLKLIQRILKASTDVGDTVWEPFGGLCSTAVASLMMRRRCYSAEILEDYYEAAAHRLSETATELNARPKQKRIFG